MARHMEWTEQQNKDWEAWLATRPPMIVEMARKFPPHTLYKIKQTGQRVFVIAYNENNTLRVAVTKKFNRVFMEKSVFGIKPEDLEECDLPGPDEDVGCTSEELGLTDDEALAVLKKAYAARKAEEK